jgi:HEAT repeat protein
MKKSVILFSIIIAVLAAGQSFATEPSQYQDFIANGASSDQLVEALKYFSYSGNKTNFWYYVKYLDYNAGENGGTDAAVFVRKTAAEALGRIKDERAIPFLIERYKKEKKDTVKSSIVYALGFYKSADSQPMIEESIASQDEDIRFQGMMAAVTLGKKEVAPKIRAIFNAEKDEGLKVVESYALFSLGDDVDGNRKLLIAGLRSSDPVVRFRSADYLARLKIDSAIDEMSKAFDIENHWWVRIEMDRTLSILYGERRRKREEAESGLFPLDRPPAPKVEEKKEEVKVPVQNEKPAVPVK